MTHYKIEMGDAASVRYWCEQLRVPEDQLRRAVDQVGPDPDKVREHLVGGFTTGGPTS